MDGVMAAVNTVLKAVIFGVFFGLAVVGLNGCASPPNDPARDAWLAQARKPLDTGAHVFWEKARKK